MSRRNSREGKARRRAERAVSQPSAEVHDFDEMVALAERGERMPCGCDAHQLLHEYLEIEAGRIPPGWQAVP